MATLGINDLKQLAIPTYWDASKLKSLELEAGYSYEQFISDVAAALSIQNAALLSAPMVAGLASTTSEAAVEYRTGVSNGFQAATEYGVPDAKRATTTGHMLPLDPFDRAFGWTWMFLQKARRIQLDADIASGMEDLRNKWEKSILERLFKNTYTAVGSGRSMPIADGGTADANYVPIPRPDRGGTFLYTHNHCGFLNGITQANLETTVAHIWEHGHDAPYDLIVSLADIASWTNTANITGFVPRPDPLLRYGVTADLANVGSEFIGAVETDYGACRVRVSGRVPTNYYAVYKSYGNLDQRNPLRVRYNPRFGVGAVLLAGDHIRQYPMENALLYMELGIGVGEDRTAAAVNFSTAGGTYVIPTIS